MTTEQFLGSLCEALSMPAGSLSLEDTRESVGEWDSMGHLAIISMLHQSFEIPGDDEGLQSFDSIGQLVERLKSRHLIQD